MRPAKVPNPGAASMATTFSRASRENTSDGGSHRRFPHTALPRYEGDDILLTDMAADALAELAVMTFGGRLAWVDGLEGNVVDSFAPSSTGRNLPRRHHVRDP
jgi:hypothetical protein